MATLNNIYNTGKFAFIDENNKFHLLPKDGLSNIIPEDENKVVKCIGLCPDCFVVLLNDGTTRIFGNCNFDGFNDVNLLSNVDDIFSDNCYLVVLFKNKTVRVFKKIILFDNYENNYEDDYEDDYEHEHDFYCDLTNVKTVVFLHGIIVLLKINGNVLFLISKNHRHRHRHHNKYNDLFTLISIEQFIIPCNNLLSLTNIEKIIPFYNYYIAIKTTGEILPFGSLSCIDFPCPYIYSNIFNNENDVKFFRNLLCVLNKNTKHLEITDLKHNMNIHYDNVKSFSCFKNGIMIILHYDGTVATSLINEQYSLCSIELEKLINVEFICCSNYYNKESIIAIHYDRTITTFVSHHNIDKQIILEIHESTL